MKKERKMLPVALLQLNEGQLDWMPRNPRQWSQDGVNKAKDSLERDPDFLDDRPLLVVPHDGAFVVYAGNMRLTAARELGVETLPCVSYEPESVEDRDTIKRRAILDNGDFGAWDWDALANEWDDLPLGDWGVPAWPSAEDEGESSSEKHTQEDDFDEEKDHIEVRCKRGDIWQLGEHRLMCGDSTSSEDFAKLMDGERADVSFTSPPYNLAASQMSEKCPNRAMHNGQAYKTYDDNVSDADYTKLLEGALTNCLAYSDDAMFNIGILKASKKGIIQMLADFKDRFCDIIVWNKNRSMPLGLPSHAGCVSHRCELIFCFNQDGSRAFSHPQWEHGAQINRIDTENASANEYAKEHAATFPVSLPAEVIKAYTKISILDCFGGTGTTMIAAEQLGRKCYMMEIDQHYCDVIIARWEKMTGDTAEKLN